MLGFHRTIQLELSLEASSEGEQVVLKRNASSMTTFITFVEACSARKLHIFALLRDRHDIEQMNGN